MITCEKKNDCQRDDKQDICELRVGERKEMGYHRAGHQNEYVYHHVIALWLDKH